MDAYLERYVDETMNAQVTRNGIFARRTLAAVSYTHLTLPTNSGV